MWREKYNITGFRNENDLVDSGITDAFHIVPYLKGTTILDIGSGAGLPGMILAIMMQEAKVTLTELRSKKIYFLKNAVRMCKLENRVRVLDARSEKLDEKFDNITCRAFSNIREVFKHGAMYMKSGTSLILPRSTKDLNECLESGGNAIIYKTGQNRRSKQMLAIFRNLGHESKI